MGKKKEPPKTPRHNLVRRGDTILLGERCKSTASGVAADYQALRWALRETGQYISQKERDGTTTVTPGELKRVFKGSVLVGDKEHPGYATDSDLLTVIEKSREKPALLAEQLMAARLGLARQTVRTYTKRRVRKN
jgi:hypothetical protein